MNKDAIKYLVASTVYSFVMIVFNQFVNGKNYTTFEYMIDFIMYAIAFAVLLVFVQLFRTKSNKK